MNLKNLNREQKIKALKILKEIQIRKARKNFWAFCIYWDFNFFHKRDFLKTVAFAFQRVSDGETTLLGISLPVRAGKSYITSLWCAWQLGNKPEGCLMRNSVTDDLAMDFSYDIREFIRDERYAKIFPGLKLRKDRFNVKCWALEQSTRFSYFCAGVGGTIIGKGASLAAIIDDSIKNPDEAVNETLLDKKFKWYLGAHSGRKEKNCPEIHIGTRWAKNDITGRLIDDGDFDKPGAELIIIPAINENGESFCEDVKTTKQLLDLREKFYKYGEEHIWMAEYMQQPVDVAGQLYPHTSLNFYDPETLQGVPDYILSVVDVADEGNDYLCAPMAYVFGTKVFIHDVVFTQEPVEVSELRLTSSIINNKVRFIRFESNAGGKLYAQRIVKLLEGNHKCQIDWKPTHQNKEARIFLKAGYIKENFYFRDDYQDHDHYNKFLNQLTRYVVKGKNSHDDAPDGLTLLAELLDEL